MDKTRMTGGLAGEGFGWPIKLETMSFEYSFGNQFASLKEHAIITVTIDRLA